MAMNVIQDQNFSLHFDGVKTKGSTIQKKRGGGLGGRKALNDISNSSKPPALNASRKQNPKNVIPIGEDVGVPKKALVDLTDSVKPITPVKKRSRKKKSIPPIPDTFHNHDECIKAQQKAQDLDEEEFWRSHTDLSMYPQLKEYFEKKDMIEDKFYLESLNPSGIPVLLTDFDRCISYTVTESP